MVENKLVSVLLPVYNVESYITESLESIQNQTYKNLEIIVIDDGSTDNTFNVVRAMAKNDDRIKLYRNEQNLKIVKTLNRALALSKGDYIARMDGDDISALDRIEKKVNFLDSNPEYSLVGCSLTTIDWEGKIINKIKKPADFNFIKKTIKYSSPVSHIWLARKTAYDELGGYRELSGAEDYDFLLRMLSSNMKFTNISDYYGYFVRLGRAGNTINTNGLYQRKLHYKLYKFNEQRLKSGSDDFNDNLKIHSSEFSKKIFRISSQLHQKALESIAKKEYLNMTFYLAASCISPYKVHYYYYSLKYKLLSKRLPK